MTETYAAVRQRRSRQSRWRGADTSLEPAHLSLAAYRRADPGVVDTLVREFGEAAALRLLNGRPAPEPSVAPFDPSLLAPPGAVGIPRAHRSKARVEVIRGEA